MACRGTALLYYCSWLRELTDLDRWQCSTSCSWPVGSVEDGRVLGVLCRRKRQFFWSRKTVLTREQRIFVVKQYSRNESYALCQEAFQEAFPNDMVPNKTTLSQSLKTLALCVIENITAVAPSWMTTHWKTWGSVLFYYNNNTKWNVGYVLKWTLCSLKHSY
jgi:hypothetical protein